MTSDQIKKLAAAGLTVEQIAVVAEVMEPQGYAGGMWDAMRRRDPLAQAGIIRLPSDKIETKVQHGELTVWPEKKPFNHDNNSVTLDH